MKKTTIALAGAFLFAAGSMMAQAADIAAGQAAFKKFTCASCHGADAKTPINPAYPILAGQHADYLRHALSAYQRGQKGAPATANIRKNPIMGAMAAQLKPADIENIAAYLASLPSPLSTQE
ncbi:c-type cytochrome [Candidimonas humi]|uniref:C-type cytochrome n=1 Tax=Candidimonas humi TaxID=683355 RepID=A0ABV8NYH7_9BURK|nr:c-type cytochrome [Candidimonas humi]MBV6305036.1 c-type cytochrome [Candidimonas humi]